MDALEFWACLESWLDRHSPEMRSLINGPATEAMVDDVESALGFTLPRQLRASYLLHDGCEPNSGLLCGIGFMPLSRMLRNWEMWSEIAADDDEDLNEACSSVPPDAVQIKYANAGWVPFAGDSQHFVAIDFCPDSAGISGQVINSGRDDEIRHVIAKDVEGFFEFVVRQFDSGIVSVIPSEGEDGPRWLRVQMSDGESHDLLTALPDLLDVRQ